jgi:hypothetical protein
VEPVARSAAEIGEVLDSIISGIVFQVANGAHQFSAQILAKSIVERAQAFADGVLSGRAAVPGFPTGLGEGRSLAKLDHGGHNGLGLLAVLAALGGAVVVAAAGTDDELVNRVTLRRRDRDRSAGGGTPRSFRIRNALQWRHRGRSKGPG